MEQHTSDVGRCQDFRNILNKMAAKPLKRALHRYEKHDNRWGMTDWMGQVLIDVAVEEPRTGVVGELYCRMLTTLRTMGSAKVDGRIPCANSATDHPESLLVQMHRVL